MKFFAWLSQLLFPEKCILCSRVLEKEEMDLCHHCRIHVNESPLPKDKLPFLDSWVALWYYEGNVRRSLLRYKFQGRQSYGESYGRLLAMKLLREDRAEYDLITYVPISDQRRRKRGFDQVELLAQEVSRQLQIPMVATMKKVRHNQPQSGIQGHAQRRANVLGAYQVLDPALLSGKSVVLLDDIVTTGATAGEAARVLLTAGANDVHLAVIARANHETKTGR